MNRPSTRDVVVAVVVCLMLALVAMVILRTMDAPWSGRTGKLVFGGSRDKMGCLGRYAGVLGCYFDSAAACREKFRVSDWIVLGRWVGVFGLALAGLVAAITAPIWVRWCRLPQGEAKAATVVSGWSAQRWSWMVMLGALLLAAAIRLPTIGGGLLWDEQDNHRRNYHGYLDFKSPEQAPKWVEVTWQQALWEDERGNNPMLYSLCAWSSNAVWRAVTGAPREQFSTVATRLPAAVTGLLSLVTLWWMLNAVGLPRIAPWAALLAAAHPMSAEFTKEARGYGFTLCFMPVFLGAGWRMLKYTRRRDCVLFGGALVIILWSFPGAFYGVATVNLTLLGMLLWQWRSGDTLAIRRIGRWTMTNSVAAVGLFALITPDLPQMTTWMNNGFQTGIMPPFWYVVSYNLFATGMHFQFPRDSFFAPHGPWPSAWAWLFGDFWRAWPVALWAMVVMPVLGIFGMVKLFRATDKSLPILMLATVAGGVACIAHHALFTGCYIYAWYAVYALPVVIIAVAAGLVGMVESKNARPGVRTGVMSGFLVAAAACWLLGISHPAVRPGGWKTDQVHIHPRPVKTDLIPEPGMIGRQTFSRGHGLWVIYADGYHVLFENHAENAAAWKPIIERSESRRGSFP